MPYALQGGPVMVMRGEATAASDPSDALVISRSFPLTYGQPLVHLKSAAGTGGILNVSSPGHAMRSVGTVFRPAVFVHVTLALCLLSQSI
jgi:pyrophosphate--fructose-6-phosphate 1-phosphotransferase